jgi:hypothetical protein
MKRNINGLAKLVMESIPTSLALADDNQIDINVIRIPNEGYITVNKTLDSASIDGLEGRRSESISFVSDQSVDSLILLQKDVLLPNRIYAASIESPVISLTKPYDETFLSDHNELVLYSHGGADIDTTQKYSGIKVTEILPLSTIIKFHQGMLNAIPSENINKDGNLNDELLMVDISEDDVLIDADINSLPISSELKMSLQVINDSFASLASDDDAITM